MSKLLESSKINVAIEVINNYESIQDDTEYHFIESFANCREQGLCLKVYNFCISENRNSDYYNFCISENKSSDDIVMYHGNSVDFDFKNNLPKNKNVWENKTYFKYNEHLDAAIFIKDIIDKLRN